MCDLDCESFIYAWLKYVTYDEPLDIRSMVVGWVWVDRGVECDGKT